MFPWPSLNHADKRNRYLVQTSYPRHKTPPMQLIQVPQAGPLLLLQSHRVAARRSSTLSKSIPSRTRVSHTWFRSPIGQCGRSQYRTLRPSPCAPRTCPRITSNWGPDNRCPQMCPMVFSNDTLAKYELATLYSGLRDGFAALACSDLFPCHLDPMTAFQISRAFLRIGLLRLKNRSGPGPPHRELSSGGPSGGALRKPSAGLLSWS